MRDMPLQKHVRGGSGGRLGTGGGKEEERKEGGRREEQRRRNFASLVQCLDMIGFD